jgi:hypothetical protein
MSRSTQESLARRRFSNHDTVLPSEALEELRRRYGPGRIASPARQPHPRSPISPSRQQQPPPVDRSREYSKLILGGLGLVAAIAALAIMIGGLKHPSGEPARLPAPAPVVQAPTPSAPAPVPLTRAPRVCRPQRRGAGICCALRADACSGP